MPDSQRIKRITESIIGLPTLPTVVSKMIELVDNPKTSAASLAWLISTDQSLTARILKLANSAYYGFSREISTVNMAIVVMGFNAVKDMGLSLSVFDMFKKSAPAGSFDISRFWEHSIGCGIASRLLAQRYQHRIAGEAFVAGLLHDIGKVILDQYAYEDFVKIMSLASSCAATLDEAEESVIGVGHATVGEWLAEKWRLPIIITQSIRYHHTPWDCGTDKIPVAIVNLANYLCHISGIGHSGRNAPIAPDDRVWDIFNQAGIALEVTDLDSLQSEFLLEFDRNDTFLSFVSPEDE
ncbi:MAG: HDOD domain-containing protein [Fibrobacterota bacterium]